MKEDRSRYALSALVVAGLATLCYMGFRNYLLQTSLNESIEREKTIKVITDTAIKNLRERQSHLAASTTELKEELEQRKADNFDLLERLASFETDNSTLQERVTAMASELGMYDKLSKTDRELLQKYSKVYFLNENYVPSSLATITPEFLLNKNRPLLIHANVMPNLTRLLLAASSSDRSLLIVSAYRSYGAQATLKSQYLLTYGIGANKFSAEQGYSEHQLGTTVDFTTPALGATFTKFDSTPAFAWLVDNAYRYGFVLSYPKHNAYYQYEPWHWRFVGVDLATRLHDEGKYFYDIPQREIDGYLVSIFDK